MFCRHCGNMLPDRAKFCDSCGAPVEMPQEPYQAPSACQQPAYSQPRQPKPSVGFLEAIKLYFQGYANFSGRSRRSEYWFAALFTGILSGLVSIIMPDFTRLVSLALLVPNLAIAVRRLHDIGKSGWYYLISFIPIGGAIWMLIQMCKDSVGDNKWGNSPKY